jgi:hypothetical protein
VKLGSIFVGLAALLALSACGSSGDQSVPSDQALQPTKGDSAWPVTDVDGVTINTPSGWDKTGPIDAMPGQLFTFQTPTNSFGTRGGAQLVTLDKRKQSAEKMVKALADEAVAIAGAKQITSTPVKWPGASSAWYLTYVAYPPHNGATAPHPTQVLVVDFAKTGQAQATVTALKEDFSPQHMHAILGTVEITDKAGTKSS